MEEENNKYLSLKEHFPGIFSFFIRHLPDTIWEEWWGDLEENIQKKTKERKYPKWQIKILYLLAILPRFHSARKMGYFNIGELISVINIRTQNSSGTTNEKSKATINSDEQTGEGLRRNIEEKRRKRWSEQVVSRRRESILKEWMEESDEMKSDIMDIIMEVKNRKKTIKQRVDIIMEKYENQEKKTIKQKY